MKYKLPFISTEFSGPAEFGGVDIYENFEDFKISVEPYDIQEGMHFDAEGASYSISSYLESYRKVKSYIHKRI